MVLGPAADLAAEQGDVQRRQFGGGVDAQLLGQALGQLLVHGQRLGAPAGLGEGAHERRDEALPHRIPGHQIGQLGDHVRAAAETDLHVHAVAEHGEIAPVQRHDRGVERVAALQRDALHGGPAPEVQRRAKQVGAHRVIRSASLSDKAFEPAHVHGIGVHVQPVAAGFRLDQPGRQHLAQPGHQDLQGVRRIRRRLVAPDPVDQPPSRNDPPGLERERRQQRPQPAAGHLHRDSVAVLDFERPEHPNSHVANLAVSKPAS